MNERFNWQALGAEVVLEKIHGGVRSRAVE